MAKLVPIARGVAIGTASKHLKRPLSTADYGGNRRHRVVRARRGGEPREDPGSVVPMTSAEAFQAQLAAEKMVAIGRGYLRVAEPEFFDLLNDEREQLDRASESFGTTRTVAERD